MVAKAKEALMNPQIMLTAILIMLTGGQYAMPNNSIDSTQIKLNQVKDIEQDKKISELKAETKEELKKLNDKLDDIPSIIEKQNEKLLKLLERK